MIPVAALLIAGLIGLYLTRPYYRPILLSSAQFFRTRQPTTTSRQFSLKSLFFSRAFWVQLLVLLFILFSLIWWDAVRVGQATGQVGVWVLIDTSASMTTQHDDGTTYDRLIRELDTLVGTLNGLPPDKRVCAQVWAFDLALRAISGTISPSEIQALAPQVQPRPLGTDLAIVERLAAQALEQRRSTVASPEICYPTHLVILTDQPAQPNLFTEADLPIVWRSLGAPADNYGLISMTSAGNPTFGGQGGLEVEVGAWGAIAPVTVSLRDANSQVIESRSVSFEGVTRRRITFERVPAGQVEVIVEPGGAYAIDDSATLFIPDRANIRVDWRVPSPYQPDIFGWTIDPTTPTLRVQPWGAPLLNDGVPTVLIGDGYGGALNEIDRFIDNSPLLLDLNFDVAEGLGVVGVPLPTESPLQPVMIDRANGVWFAQSTTPPAALIPSIPLFEGDESLIAFSTTSFFNAVAWLLEAGQPASLYRLTTAAVPEPEIGRLALHAGEGDTTLIASDLGQWQDIQVTDSAIPEPIWPLLVCAAVLFFVIERLLTMLRGHAWY